MFYHLVVFDLHWTLTFRPKVWAGLHEGLPYIVSEWDVIQQYEQTALQSSNNAGIYTVSVRVHARVGTFSLSQSGTGVWEQGHNIIPGKLLEFYMWSGARWCNLVAVRPICRPPDGDPLGYICNVACNTNSTDPDRVYCTRSIITTVSIVIVIINIISPTSTTFPQAGKLV